MDRAADIDCPVNLFPRQNREITRLTQAINQATAVSDKVRWAENLVDAVDILLGCTHYNEDSLDCRLCQSLSGLRRKTATLVMTAGRLGRN